MLSSARVDKLGGARPGAEHRGNTGETRRPAVLGRSLSTTLSQMLNVADDVAPKAMAEGFRPRCGMFVRSGPYVIRFPTTAVAGDEVAFGCGKAWLLT